jgi:hypothetical protein
MLLGAGLISLLLTPKKSKMGQITTKMNLGNTGYVMTSNKIAAVVVDDIRIDEKSGAIQNDCVTADGGAATYEEAEIWPTPDALAADLVAQFKATMPPAGEPSASTAE